MPPTLDAYILSRYRNLDTINQFIADYIDSDASEDRGDKELMLVPLLFTGDINQLRLGEFEWEPALTLTNIIEYGLSYPRRAFWVFLKCKDPVFANATLGFTTDNQLVLGLSIDDAGAKPENLHSAKLMLRDLARKYRGYLGVVTVELPPPLNEWEFRKIVKDSLTVFFSEFEVSQSE